MEYKLSFFLFLFSSAWIQGVDGDLDPTFGVGGLVITDFGGKDAVGRVGVHIQTDGKIVVFSNTTAGGNLSNLFNFALARYLPNGSLDNTFGNNGLVITDLGGNEFSGDIAIQADGRIVVAGENKLVRYDTNGSLDTSFGTNGEVNTSVDALVDIIIQPDQHIVISGSQNDNFILARYLPNGNLDLTFGTNGIVVTDFGGFESNTAVAIQQDGKILVGGSTDQGPNPNNFALARYNKNGTLDTTFGSSGLVITDFNGGNDVAHDIAVQADGKILVSGTTLSGVIGDLAVARYNTDGSLDNTFGTNGLTVIDFGGSEDPFRVSLGIQGDGKILVSGDTTVGANPRNFAITRLLTTGLVDTSFGVNGLVITDFNGRDDTSNTVAIQEDGKFVVVGFTSVGDNSDFGVARYLSTPILVPTTINQAGTNNGNLILSGTAQNLSSITILADGVPVCSTFTQGTGLIGTWTCSISLPNEIFGIKAVSTYYAGRINLETDTIKITLNGSDTEVTLNRSALSQAIRNKYCPTL